MMRIPGHIDAPRELVTKHNEIMCWKCSKPSLSHRNICQGCLDAALVPVVSKSKKLTRKERGAK